MKNPPENSVQPSSRAAWRAWLSDQGERDAGVWLVLFKKAADGPTLSLDDVVELYAAGYPRVNFQCEAKSYAGEAYSGNS